MGRIAIIIIAAIGLYAVVTSMRETQEDTTSSMPDVETAMPSKDDMSKDKMKDDMADTMPKLSREAETTQLLAELKTIPVSEFAANLSRYEPLLELHPGNETFSYKAAFYTEKLYGN